MATAMGGGGGSNGFRHLLEHLGPAAQKWVDDMREHAFELTTENIDSLTRSVDKELQGKDLKELEAERDAKLVELFKRKGKQQRMRQDRIRLGTQMCSLVRPSGAVFLGRSGENGVRSRDVNVISRASRLGTRPERFVKGCAFAVIFCQKQMKIQSSHLSQSLIGSLAKYVTKRSHVPTAVPRAHVCRTGHISIVTVSWRSKSIDRMCMSASLCVRGTRMTSD